MVVEDCKHTFRYDGHFNSDTSVTRHVCVCVNMYLYKVTAGCLQVHTR